MTTKPFWEPTQTLAAMAHGHSATTMPRTNWGATINRKGSRDYSVGSVWLHATLTDQDVRALSALELDTQHFNPTICALFQQLMLALPAAQRPGGAVQETWIDELLCLLPACVHDHTRYYSASACASEYIELGVAPLLLPLYTLMLRGDFWLRQIDSYTRGRVAHNNWVRGDASDAETESSPVQSILASNGYDLNELAGDPCGLIYPIGQRWSTDFMDTRETLFSKGYRKGGKINEFVQDLLFTLDVMAQVVATLDSGLQDRMAAYSRWTTQI